MKKTKTMQLQGNDYAKVAERLKIFREENPKGKQESFFTTDENGTTVFKVYLWKDKTDIMELMKSGVVDREVLCSSADSNGTARGEQKAKKDFEKLESIALGRALANLGYLASGDIASSEEMEEFLNFKENQKIEARIHAIEKIEECKTLAELQEVWKSLGTVIQDKEVVAKKDELKITLK